MVDNELYHHGVKGMKWGVHKLRTAKSVAESSSKIFKEGANIAGTGGNNRRPSKAMKKELSSMSDQELRAKINRLNMEQQYANLSPSRSARGAAFAKATLEVAGSVAAIGSSALAIALAIKSAKG
jgi:hypothetical protein